MKRHDTGIKNTRLKALARKILAAVLLMAMILPLFPKEAFAAADSTSANLNWKKISDLYPAGAKIAHTGKNLYILEVSTGTIRDNGNADNVLYFNVHYTAGSSKKSVLLMPHLDAIENGFELAEKAGATFSSEKMKSAQEIFGFNPIDITNVDALHSVSTDQIMFQTEEAITSIDKIQIFGMHTPDETTWSCQSLRIYRVDQLLENEMVGWYSAYGYIDFTGEVICDMAMSESGGNFKWRTTGGTFNVVKYGDQGGVADCTLVNASQASAYGRPTQAGKKHQSQKKINVVLRLDLADQAFAGFESLACKYENGSKPQLKDMGFVETAALTVRYSDVWGDVREVTVPFAACAIGSLSKLISDPRIAGYAQQGDTIAVPLLLPDYQGIVNVSITIGGEPALTKCGLSASTSSDTATERFQTTKTDELRYTCFAVYEDASQCEAAIDGATVRYRFNGDPVKVSTASTVEGVRVAAGTENYFYLQNYNDKLVLNPVDNQERYLVSLYTDNVINAGTRDDLMIQFTYTNFDGSSVTSPEFNVRDYVNQFYGYWGGNVDEFAYSYGMSQGAKIQFLLPIPNVMRFTSVSYKLSGEDEWQVKGITMQFVESYEQRIASFSETKSKEIDPDDPANARYLSHLEYTRKVDAHSISFSAGAVTGDMATNPDYDPDEDPGADPNSEDWVPGDLVQDDGEWKQFDSEGKQVVNREDVDWNDLINNMTYEDAQKDLGFTKQRRNYTVHVKVAGDKVTDNNDDCGSANLFYFQLIFERGTSGCVLANQQIDGDAFRTGADVYFDIPTVIDYGDLSAVMVLPDDQDSNGNIYDKLKIKYIEVMQNTDAALTPTWRIDGASEEGLGWVGIEYRDPGESSTIKGMEGHTAAEIATTYEVTASSYSAKLLVSITTGAYKRTTGIATDGTPEYEDCKQLVGGMSMDYSYEDANSQVQTVDGIDIVYQMDQYAGRESSYERTYDDGVGARSTKVTYAVSNPEYTFRAGKTDRFYLNVSDITKLNTLTLYTRADEVTYWHIDNVSVHLVNGKGRRYINKSGEISYRYDEGAGLSFITQWVNDTTLETYIPVYGGGTSGIQKIDISLQNNPIKTDEKTNSWAPVINREPKSKNDTLNLFIYPGTAENASDPSSYGLNASVIYTDAMTLEPMGAGAGQLDFSYNQDGQPVFSKVGISATNLDSITGVTVKTTSKGTLKAPISYGVLQRVRSGVLIETYYLTGAVNADSKSTLSITTSPKVQPGIQRVMMQVLSYNPLQDLIAENRDMAVAVYFTPSGAPDQEIRSKYIYLTDAGYKMVKPGQLLELDFDLGDVSEIRGLNIVKTGNLDLTIENVYIVTQKPSGEIIRKYYIENGFMPSLTPSRVNMIGNVELVQLDIKTALDTTTSGSGTTDPVRARIGYYDIYDSEQEYEISNIRPYLEADTADTYNIKDKALQSGKEDHLKILIPRLESLRYVKLEPYNANDADIASWTPESLSATVGLDGATVSRQINKTIVEGSEETVFLADMVLVSNIRLSGSDGEPLESEPEFYVKADSESTAERRTNASIKSPEIGTLTVESGTRIMLNTRVSGSSKGYTYKFWQIDPETGLEEEADLSKGTYSYKEEELDEIYARAVQSIGPDVTDEKEIEAAKAVIERINSMRSGKGSISGPSEDDSSSVDIVFQTPRNYSDRKLQYRIVVTAKENSTNSFTLDIYVSKQNDDLEKLIEDWEKVQTVGTVSVLNTSGGVEETTDLKQNDQKSLLIESGEGVKITPRVDASEGFTAVINGYDSATQAKGRADLNVQTNYPEDTLLRYETEANTILSAAESTDDERSEAQNVLNIISAMRSGSGSFSPGTSEVLLNAPRNYTGASLSYIITVTNSSTGSEFFSLIVTVKSETDTLANAYAQLEKAKAAGDEERKQAAEAASKSEEEANTPPENGGTSTDQNGGENASDNQGGGSGDNTENNNGGGDDAGGENGENG